MSGTLILVIASDLNFAGTLHGILYRAGYQVQTKLDIQDAMNFSSQQMPDMVLLDLEMMSQDTRAFIRWMRERSKAPIIAITARRATFDRLSLMAYGADDYIERPFSAQELLSRIQMIFRKAVDATEPIPPSPLSFQDLRIDPSSRLVFRGEKEIILTNKEFDLLWLLASNPGKIFSREQLLERIWGSSEYIDPGTVTVHVRRLREKIEKDPAKPIHIHTIWGVGYKFEPG